MNLLRAEILKIRTTSSWWLFGGAALVTLALAFAYNAVSAHFLLNTPLPTEDAGPGDIAKAKALATVVNQATNLYTSGQFFGLLFVLLLGIIVVTNEFYHQTATTTFLTTPQRTRVVFAKLGAAALFGGLLWLVTTAITIPATIFFLSTEHVPNQLGSTEAIRAMALNLLAYVLWGVLGVGFGVLIRSQIGATITAVVLYLLGTTAAGLVFLLLKQWLHWEWVDKLQVIVPSIASALMITGTELPGNPPQWVGAAVLIGYAVVTGTVGTLIMRHRDIS